MICFKSHDDDDDDDGGRIIGTVLEYSICVGWNKVNEQAIQKNKQNVY